jgi:hypothetical protein
VFIEEQMQQQRPDELKQTVSPASFAQAATYSSLAQQQQQKPALQSFTEGPPGFTVQRQSQFQPIPTLEQEQESNAWNGDGDELGQRGGYRGKGFSRGGRGRGGGGDRNGYAGRPRQQNGQGRPGNFLNFISIIISLLHIVLISS